MAIEISAVIPEKDILSKDLFTKAGILLLKAGTVITSSYKKRLKGFGILEVFVI